MDRVLYVSQSDITTELLKLLKQLGYDKLSIAKSSSMARRMVCESHYALVLINAPLPDEYGHELAISCVEQNVSGVVMLVKAEKLLSVEMKVEDFGIPVVSRPISFEAFYRCLKIIKATQFRFDKVLLEKSKVEEKLREFKIISRAKCLLIEKKEMTEEQAHRLIEKTAMNTRKTKAKVAEEFIDELAGL